MRHIEGQGIGDVDAYTNLGFTKFAWTDSGVVLFDLAARITNEAEPGFTVGLHRRALFSGVLLGSGIFYDQQEDFHQGSIGDFFSEAEITGNTANNNTLEGMRLLFAGTGTSIVHVLNNNFAGNNGGVGREFFAENQDAIGNATVVFVELDGNTSANALGAGPPFNYEFANEDLFADSEMTLEVGANVGTVENDPEVDEGDVP